MMLFTFTFAIMLAAQDIKTRHVSILVAAAFLLSLMPYLIFSTESIIVAFMIGVALGWPLIRKWLAPTDFIFLIISPVLIPIHILPLFLIGLGVLAFSYHFISKEEKAPFLAFYVVALMPLLLWQWR